MTHKILVLYATKCGSTAEVAEAIAQAWREQGAVADTSCFAQAPDLAGYSAVAIGSAIRMGAWLPEAVRYVSEHAAELRQRPVAYYTVHMLNTGDTPQERAAREAYTAPARALLAPQAEAFFAGRIQRARLSVLDKLIAGLMRAVDEDRRDWQAIGAWAAATLPALEGAGQ